MTTTPYQATQRAEYAELRALGAGVAEDLTRVSGSGWTLAAEDESLDYVPSAVYLDGEDGGRLALNRQWGDGSRVSVSGVYPRHEKHGMPYGVKHPEATCAISRGSLAIARDAHRKVLPTYLEQLSAVTAKYERDDSAAAARDVVAAALGGDRTGHTFGSPDASVRLDVPGGGFGSARISYEGDTVSMELHAVPTDVAVKVAALLRGES